VAEITFLPVFAGSSSAHIHAYAGLVRKALDCLKILIVQERGSPGVVLLVVVRVFILFFFCGGRTCALSLVAVARCLGTA
jgi:hypothetical protein